MSKTEKVIYVICGMILGILYMASLLGYRIVISTGTSMLPTLKENHIIIAKEIDDNGLKENDIGIYWDEEKAFWVNHRIIYKTENGYIFKGDNNQSFDDFIPKEWVKYKAIVY